MHFSFINTETETKKNDIRTILNSLIIQTCLFFFSILQISPLPYLHTVSHFGLEPQRSTVWMVPSATKVHCPLLSAMTPRSLVFNAAFEGKFSTPAENVCLL